MLLFKRAFTPSKVKETKEAKIRKLEDGTKYINEYKFDKLLGQGFYAKVKLVIKEST